MRVARPGGVGGHPQQRMERGWGRHVPGEEAEEIRPRRYVVDSKTETRRPKVEGERRKCRSFVSARGVKPHTGVGGDFWSEGGGVSQFAQRSFLRKMLGKSCKIA